MITNVHKKQKDQLRARFSILKNNSMGAKLKRRISIDLSKAFDMINRNKIRRILYEKGIPMPIIHNIIKGHHDNILRGKHNGAMGNKIPYNKGAPQGIPISALLYITFADGITHEYKQELRKHPIKKITMIVKNLPIEFRRENFQISETHQDDPEKKIERGTSDPTQTININEDKTLFSDDAGIAFGKPEDIPPKLQIYDEITKNIPSWQIGEKCPS